MSTTVSELKKKFDALGIDAKTLHEIPFLSDFNKNPPNTQALIQLLNAMHSRASIVETICGIALKKEYDEQAVRADFYKTKYFQSLYFQHTKNLSEIDMNESVKKSTPYAMVNTLLVCLRIFKFMPRLQAFGLAVVYSRNPEGVKQLFKDNKEKTLAFICDKVIQEIIRDMVNQKAVYKDFYDLYQHAQLLVLKLNSFLMAGPKNVEEALLLLSKQAWLNKGIEAIIETYLQYCTKYPFEAKTLSELDALYSNFKNKWVLNPSIEAIQQEKDKTASILNDLCSAVHHELVSERETLSQRLRRLPPSVSHMHNRGKMDLLSFSIGTGDGNTTLILHMQISGLPEWFNPKLYFEGVTEACINTIECMTALDLAENNAKRKQESLDKLPNVVKPVPLSEARPSPMAMAGAAIAAGTAVAGELPPPSSVKAKLQLPPQPQAGKKEKEDELTQALRESGEAEEQRKADLKRKINLILTDDIRKENKELVERLITLLIENPTQFPRQQDALHLSVADVGVAMGILPKLAAPISGTALGHNFASAAVAAGAVGSGAARDTTFVPAPARIASTQQGERPIQTSSNGSNLPKSKETTHPDEAAAIALALVQSLKKEENDGGAKHRQEQRNIGANTGMAAAGGPPAINAQTVARAAAAANQSGSATRGTLSTGAAGSAGAPALKVTTATLGLSNMTDAEQLAYVLMISSEATPGATAILKVKP